VVVWVGETLTVPVVREDWEPTELSMLTEVGEPVIFQDRVVEPP
jgi:hypothetical protein